MSEYSIFNFYYKIRKKKYSNNENNDVKQINI